MKKVSRRGLRRAGMTAAALAGAGALRRNALAGQGTTATTPSASRQRFRAYVRFGTGASLQS